MVLPQRGSKHTEMINYELAQTLLDGHVINMDQNTNVYEQSYSYTEDYSAEDVL